ncbi:LemA family protein [Paracoccus siganidrum]|uniref:LemA family protein n=1 Tax=Paracoccus siganidrum TaxID=1276757 RepID=A0A418ZTD5_9RHOB|nr:LemA family protein [Paracoccus siganidrum]RJL01221.1 LemA family protein [Paracoccus siganidrum]RMC26975.1 LemA family protein [Paracoccus siganidrum]
MNWIIILAIAAGGLALYAVAVYNRLVGLRQRTREAWSGIDVQLKRRSNLIPNLVETVRGYVTHEKDLLDQITRSRAAASGSDSVAERAAVEGQLGAVLGRLFAVAEAYPDLKASRNFQDLHASLDGIERDIQHVRRYYNGAVRMLNIAVQSFPSNLIAGLFGFRQADYFELDDPSERAVPQVAF